MPYGLVAIWSRIARREIFVFWSYNPRINVQGFSFLSGDSFRFSICFPVRTEVVWNPVLTIEDRLLTLLSQTRTLGMSESARRFVHGTAGATFGRGCQEIGGEKVFRKGEALT